ncbi:MAG: hypothetical protein ACEQR8_06200 [Cypionkella sp.]
MQPPPPSSPPAPKRRRRIPAFHPVPVGPRRDGWTPARQAHFIGLLAQTGSVSEAAALVGMRRESAYRLRARPGAAGFAAAWDAALARPHKRVDLASTKATGIEPGVRYASGLVQVVVYRGRYRGSHRKDDINALLQHNARLSRGMPEWW